MWESQSIYDFVGNSLDIINRSNIKDSRSRIGKKFNYIDRNSRLLLIFFIFLLFISHMNTTQKLWINRKNIYAKQQNSADADTENGNEFSFYRKATWTRQRWRWKFSVLRWKICAKKLWRGVASVEWSKSRLSHVQLVHKQSTSRCNFFSASDDPIDWRRALSKISNRDKFIHHDEN